MLKTTHYADISDYLPPLVRLRRSRTMNSLCTLNALKEALFLMLAPFFPEKMSSLGAPDGLFAPLFA